MAIVRDYLPALGVFVLGIALWEAVVFALSIEFYLLPAPHVIVASLAQTYPVLLEAGLYTFGEALGGYALGCGLALVGAALASRSPAVAERAPALRHRLGLGARSSRWRRSRSSGSGSARARRSPSRPS